MEKFICLVLLLGGCASGAGNESQKARLQEERARASVERMQDEFNQLTQDAN